MPDTGKPAKTRAYDFDTHDPGNLRLKKLASQADDQTPLPTASRTTRETQRFSVELLYRLIDAIKHV